MPHSQLLQRIGQERWDSSSNPTEPSPYVDWCLQKARAVCSRLAQPQLGSPGGAADGLLLVTPAAADALWSELSSHVALALVDGFALARRCSPEGRASMSLDAKSLLSGMDEMWAGSGHPPAPCPLPPSHPPDATRYGAQSPPLAYARSREFVLEWVKAFYFEGEGDLFGWIAEHRNECVALAPSPPPPPSLPRARSRRRAHAHLPPPRRYSVQQLQAIAATGIGSHLRRKQRQELDAKIFALCAR